MLVNLPGKKPYAWEPDALLAARKGIRSLFLGPALTFLTLEMRGRPELRFAKTVLKDGGQVLQFHPD